MPGFLRPRRYPCLVWLLLPMWPPTVVLLRTTFTRARAMFGAPVPGQLADPAVAFVQRLRSGTGLVATLLVLGAADAADAYFEFRLNSLILLPLTLLVAGPLIVAVFVRCAPERHRPTLRARLPVPLVLAGKYLALMGLLLAGLWLYDTGWGAPAGNVAGTLYALVLGVAVLWLLVLWIIASFYGGRGLFGIAAVHAALPPVITAVVVWVMAAFGLFAYGLGEGPVWWQYTRLIGAPASATAVALWELRWLRTRYGIRIRV